MLSTAVVTCVAATACSDMPRLTAAIILVSASVAFTICSEPVDCSARARVVDAAPRRIDSVAVTISATDRACSFADRCTCAARWRGALRRLQHVARGGRLLRHGLADLLRDLPHLRSCPARCSSLTSTCSAVDAATTRACSLVVVTADTTVRAAASCSSVARAICDTTPPTSPRPPRIFLSAVGAAFGERVALVGDAHALGGRGHRFVRHVLQRPDDGADVGGRLRRPIREVPDLFGHDREPAAGVAGARGLDRGVQRQQVGALGDQVDGVDDAADLIGALAHLAHDDGGLHHRVAQPADALDRSLNRGAALFGVPRHPAGDVIALLDESGDRL